MKEKKRYVSYNTRLVILIVIFLITFGGCLIAAKYSFEYSEGKEIDYSESEGVDYKVYLKDNNFYEEEYLGKNMVYVASLIKKIELELGYKLKIEEKVDMEYNYKIVGNLVIKDGQGKNTYFTKEYELKEEQKEKIKEKDEIKIEEEVEIDYNYYNSLANKFKTEYGLETTSYLEVKLEIEKKSDKEKVNINEESEVGITIPLSEKAIQIKFNSKDTSIIRKAIIDKKLEFNTKVFGIEIILFVITIIVVKKIIELIVMLPKKKSEYDKYIESIIKEYDRLIVSTTTRVEEEKNHIIEIKEFKELLDVRDTLKLPIMYYEIVKHQKSYFYIKNGKDVYMYKVKASQVGKNDREI